MGEAKRRKALDPNFGKAEVYITKSENTNNWLINVNEHCFDSALEYEDAEKIADWLEKEIKVHPIPRKCTPHQFQNWVLKYAQSSPKADSEMFLMSPNKEGIEKTTYQNIMSSHSKSE